MENICSWRMQELLLPVALRILQYLVTVLLCSLFLWRIYIAGFCIWGVRRSSKVLSTRTSWGGQGRETCIHWENWHGGPSMVAGDNDTRKILEIPHTWVWKDTQLEVSSMFHCCKLPYWLWHYHFGCRRRGRCSFQKLIRVTCMSMCSTCSLLVAFSWWCRALKTLASQQGISSWVFTRLIMLIIQRYFTYPLLQDHYSFWVR